MNYTRFFEQAIGALKRAGNYRVFTDLERRVGQFPRAKDHSINQEITIWCSNDYLGMGQHPDVLEAMTAAVQTMGAGAGGTRNISGTNHPLVLLEEELADLHKKESALVFTSGYVSNSTVLATLGKLLPNLVIFSDECNHASMIEGIRHSKAEKHVFRHNDVAHLRELIAAVDPERPKLIAFESVYSMDGDIAPIKAFCDIADEFKALTYLDEVHAVGLYGSRGGGISERDSLQDRLTFIQGTLGKAFGVMGGYVTGDETMMDALRSYSPGFIFTTALPPALCAAALKSVQHLKSSNTERMQLHANAAKLKALLKESQIPVMDTTESHIVPVFVGEANKCRLASEILRDKHGIFVQHINHPTVPKGTERLRICPSPVHSAEMMNALVSALVDVFAELELEYKAA
jgi:5-aminolevulinate synthase